MFRLCCFFPASLSEHDDVIFLFYAGSFVAGPSFRKSVTYWAFAFHEIFPLTTDRCGVRRCPYFLAASTPTQDVQNFIEGFEEKYGTTHPVFYQGGYKEVQYEDRTLCNLRMEIESSYRRNSNDNWISESYLTLVANYRLIRMPRENYGSCFCTYTRTTLTIPTVSAGTVVDVRRTAFSWEAQWLTSFRNLGTLSDSSSLNQMGRMQMN